MMGSYVADSVRLVNVQVAYSWVTCFRYSKAFIIAAAYQNVVPLGDSVCVVLMEAPILANSFLNFSIDVWVRWPITLVIVFSKR